MHKTSRSVAGFVHGAVFGLTLMLSACGGGGGGGTTDSGGPKPNGDSTATRENFLPLELGNTWTLAGGGNVFQQRVTATQALANGTAWVVATLDDDHIYEERLEQRAEGIYAVPTEHDSEALRALGPILKLKMPLVAGDRYSALPERTLSAIADFDGDGKLDDLTIQVDTEVLNIAGLEVGGRRFAKVAHVRTTSKLAQRLRSGAVRHSTAVSDDWYADQVGLVQAEYRQDDAQGQASSKVQLLAAHAGTFRTESTPPLIDEHSSTFDGKTSAPEMWLHFSEPMDVLMDLSKSVRLVDPKGQEVKVVPLWENPRTLRILTRHTWLEGSYQFELTGAPEDLAGNPLATAFKRSFRVDAIGPQVLRTEPANGATGVSRSTVIRVVFDEPIVPSMGTGYSGATLSRGRYSGSVVPSEVTMEDARTMVIRPLALLDLGVEYNVLLEVKDATGNTIPFEQRQVSFRVETGLFDLAIPGAVPESRLGLGANAVLTDFTGDGRLDLVTIGSAPIGSSLTSQGIWLHWFDSDGVLKREAVPATFGRYRKVEALAAGDATGRGPSDLFVANSDGKVDWIFQPGPNQVLVTEVLSDVWSVQALGVVPIAADQGRGALLVAGGTLHLYRQLNAQKWQGPYPVMDQFYNGKFALADLDGDQRVDIVAIDSLRRIGVFRQHENGRFVRIQYGVLFPGSTIIDFKLGDLNHDRRPDLLVSQRGANGGDELVRLLQAEDGTFGAVDVFGPFDGYVGSVLIGDLNGDGRNDALLGLRSQQEGSHARFFTQSNDGKLRAESSLVFDQELWTESLLLGNLNGDGFADLISGTNIHLNRGKKSPSASASRLDRMFFP